MKNRCHREDFFDAVRELWQEGRFQSAPALPSVAFLGWDGAGLDELEHLLDQVPVNLDSFNRDFDCTDFGAADEQINDLNITPVRIARHQAQGVHTHDSFEIDYVARGSARLIFGGNFRVLPAGSLCLISPALFSRGCRGG